MSTPPQYRSDRWVTPGVVVVFILAGAVVVLAVLAAVTYLTARGYDPAPIVQLAGTLLAAAGALGTFLQGLFNRRTITKVERNNGQLASAVADVVDVISPPPPRAAAPPPVPPSARRRHAYPDTGAAPAARGS